MSYAVWPDTLPKTFMLDGLSGEEPDVTIREEMDVGPAKVRARFTAAAELMSGKILLNATQYPVFQVFFRTTLRRGVLPFTWTDPRDLSAGVFRFVGAYSWESWEGRWVISFQAERLPV